MASDIILTPTEANAPVPPPPALGPTHGQGFAPRAGAYLLDLLVMVIAGWLILFATGLAFGLLLGLLNITPRVELLARYAGLLNLGAFLLYFMLSEWLGGSSPGKLLLGLRVVQQDGRPCSFGAALLRGMLRFVDSIFFCLPALLSMRAPLHQRLGDRAARTLVVHAGDPGRHAPRPAWGVLAAQAIWMMAYGCGAGLLLLLGSLA